MAPVVAEQLHCWLPTRRWSEFFPDASCARGCRAHDCLAWVCCTFGAVPLQYVGIAEALRSGNIEQYRREMTRHRVRLMRAGVYLLLEKLQPLIMRRLFKRM